MCKSNDNQQAVIIIYKLKFVEGIRGVISSIKFWRWTTLTLENNDLHMQELKGCVTRHKNKMIERDHNCIE